jgi:hypothetical protein
MMKVSFRKAGVPSIGVDHGIHEDDPVTPYPVKGQDISYRRFFDGYK